MLLFDDVPYRYSHRFHWRHDRLEMPGLTQASMSTVASFPLVVSSAQGPDVENGDAWLGSVCDLEEVVCITAHSTVVCTLYTIFYSTMQSKEQSLEKIELMFFFNNSSNEPLRGHNSSLYTRWTIKSLHVRAPVVHEQPRGGKTMDYA